MRSVAKQVEIGGLTSDADEDLEIEAGYVWREQLWSAMRSFVESYIDAENGLKKYDGCAYRLNKRWEPKGRPVTAGSLKQALLDAERNNFRAEWLDWFAARSLDVAELMARRVKPTKTPEERLADLEEEVRGFLAHKQADALIRRSRAR